MYLILITLISIINICIDENSVKQRRNLRNISLHGVRKFTDSLNSSHTLVLYGQTVLIVRVNSLNHMTFLFYFYTNNINIKVFSILDPEKATLQLKLSFLVIGTLRVRLSCCVVVQLFGKLYIRRATSKSVSEKKTQQTPT